MGRRGQPKGTTIPPPGWLVKGAKFVETMWTIVSDPYRKDHGDMCKRWTVVLQCECGTTREMSLGDIRRPHTFTLCCRECYRKMSKEDKVHLGMSPRYRDSWRLPYVVQTRQKGRSRRYMRQFSTTRQRLGPCWPDPKVMMPDGTIYEGGCDE